MPGIEDRADKAWEQWLSEFDAGFKKGYPVLLADLEDAFKEGYLLGAGQAASDYTAYYVGSST